MLITFYKILHEKKEILCRIIEPSDQRTFAAINILDHANEPSDYRNVYTEQFVVTVHH